MNDITKLLKAKNIVKQIKEKTNCYFSNEEEILEIILKEI